MKNLVHSRFHTLIQEGKTFEYYKNVFKEEGEKVLIIVNDNNRQQYIVCSMGRYQEFLYSLNLSHDGHVSITFLKRINYEQYEKENK